MSNFQQQDNFRKNTKLLSEIADKINQNRKTPQSHKKNNSKLYLKKNGISNISVLNETGPNILSTQPNTNLNNNNISNDPKIKFMKNRLNNIKFNIGKSSQNFLNSKNSSNNLKKNAGSACELIDNNSYLRKSQSKNNNIVEINNLNPIGYIYNNEKSFFSPKNHGSNPKLIFLKNKEKSKFFDENASKDEKNNQNKEDEQNNNEGNKKKQINCLLRNTFTNVKIYPTTILNNKIIYNQIDKNNQNNNNNNQTTKNTKSESSNNNSSVHFNNSKIKKEKIVIETVDKKPNNNKKEDFQSIEELHYFYVNALQEGKKYAIKLDN